MKGIFLLLGSNLGDREEVLHKAIETLKSNKIQVIEKSFIYETAAWGIRNQQAFLNQIVEIETSLTPPELLQLILNIELQLGRVRQRKWGERIIDIDILYYHNYVCEEKDLQIPHPGIPDRKFTLIPLVEMCPDQIHPVLKRSQKQLLESCKDELEVSLFVN
jgi:2-amino-4-hydroxy-6-hydroxymethyldihydropteridine diphosphokinase